MNKKIVWVIVDKRNGNEPFWNIFGCYHVFRTRKLARKFLDEQFFEAKDMGWRVKKYTLNQPR